MHTKVTIYTRTIKHSVKVTNVNQSAKQNQNHNQKPNNKLQTNKSAIQQHAKINHTKKAIRAALKYQPTNTSQ